MTKTVESKKSRFSKVAKEAQKVLRKFEEYEQTKPEQLLLFEFLDPKDSAYSNTVELYDSTPKYDYSRSKVVEPVKKREFEYRGRPYRVTIFPSKIEGKDGRYYDCYPSQREELVEDALRKIACEGSGLLLNNEAGVPFTLYQLQQELSKRGHGYNLTSIKEALFVCRGTRIVISNPDGTAVIDSNIFTALGLSTKDQSKQERDNSKGFVIFNPLVTKSILEKTFRRLNYEKAMEYKSAIARQLHKRLSHVWKQASTYRDGHYSILASTLIRDFGLTVYPDFRNNLREIEKALDEMIYSNPVEDDKKKKGWVLDKYSIEKRYSATRGRKRVVDALITLVPTNNFTVEMMHANNRSKEIQGEIQSHKNRYR